MTPPPLAPAKAPVPDATVNVPNARAPHAEPWTARRSVLPGSFASVSVRRPLTDVHPGAGPTLLGPKSSSVLTAPKPAIVPVPQNTVAPHGFSWSRASNGRVAAPAGPATRAAARAAAMGASL